MQRLSKSCEAPDRGTEDHGALAKGIASVAPGGLPTPVLLMGTGDQLSIPRLEGVALEYCYSAGDSALIALARMLLELDLAAPEQWEPAHHDPEAYVLNALKCWIATHGGDSIRRRFDLYVTLTSYLDEYSEKNEKNPDGAQLYLTVDPDRCGFVVLGPTLELLESVHPELPATFYHVFAGALNGWVRIYDFRDAEADVLGSAQGDSVKRIAEIFARAKEHSPSLIFLDEMDGLLPGNNRYVAQHDIQVVEQCLTEISNLQPEHNVFLVGTTNHPENIDPRVLRGGRFSEKIKIGLPGTTEVQRLLRKYLVNILLEPGLDLGQLSERLAGLAPADLEAISNAAKRFAFDRVGEGNELPPLRWADFEKAWQRVKTPV